MKLIAFAIAVTTGFCLTLWVTSDSFVDGWHRSAEPVSGDSEVSIVSLQGATIRASGNIEGKTETVEMRARITEQVLAVKVVRGQTVTPGDVLIELDSGQLKRKLDLAKSMLTMSVAKKTRLENGARASEVSAAKSECEAVRAPLWSAQRALERGGRLYDANAISRQELDQLTANANSLYAKFSAAEARLKTIELPAREDDLDTADAAIQEATSRIRLAEIELDRATIKAPIAGRVLEVNAHVGELNGPQSELPLLVIVESGPPRVVAEVDEFDALNVRIGQRCEITCDAQESVLAHGKIVEVEPSMSPKRMFRQRTGERTDAFSRKVWIELAGSVELPIGLPIEVAIQVE